nr:Chain B, HIS-LYS-ILE-LEU-HIS-ARG-LEU-LEU-GLN-ASP-SER [Homo sapiens]
HKILHRLLQDS